MHQPTCFENLMKYVQTFFLNFTPQIIYNFLSKTTLKVENRIIFTAPKDDERRKHKNKTHINV